jgi:serine/threonine-protein kinase
LERRIHAGEDCRAEEFFAACPALAEDVECAKDLIYTEYDALRRAGRRPDLEEFYRRYARWRTELERLIAIDDLLDGPPEERVLHLRLPDGSAEQYRVIAEVARGPDSRVHKARRGRDGRVVAVKTFAGDDLTFAEPFRVGAVAQQRLRHPNILPVCAVGESEDGLPCFVMEFAEAGSLDQKIAGRPQPAEESARLVQTLAVAVSYAHREGVVHCDLKPANVVLAADGTPRITDFGLARRPDAGGTGTTKDGRIAGTPAYMAPEQAAGRTSAIGPLSDVYSLGAILFELLTGQPPFQGRTVVEVLQQVRSRHPRRPRRLERRVPRALESICLQCLEKTPGRRYPSAQALADDLGRWLERRRPRAHRPHARAGRLLRRHPALCTVAALVALAAVAVPAMVYFTDPQRKAEEIEARLARGEEVQLVPEKGLPRYRRWVTADPTQKAVQATDETFRLESESWAMQELVRDPQTTRYHLSARVRHDQVREQGGHAGVYFAYSKHQTDRGAEHCFCCVQLKAATAVRDLGPGLPGNEMELGVVRYPEPRSCRDCTVRSLPLPITFWEAQTVWITVGLDVSPEDFRLTLRKEGQIGVSQSGPADRKAVEKAKNSVCRAAEPGPPEVDPPLGPRGSLGLYVYRGAASFRDVVLTPKPSPRSP